MASREAQVGTRPGSSHDDKGIWSKLLDRVATGKKLPEKRLVVLGGTPESQAAFVEAISQEPNQRQPLPNQTQVKKPPFANHFALGYTYKDILDADHDDILARLSFYLLADYSPSFGSLLKPLFTPLTIPNTLVVILLDWTSPLSWLRQLRNWIRLLRSVLNTADEDCKEAMEVNMKEWRERSKSNTIESPSANAQVDATSFQLGAGEWDEALGVPLCVVCQNAEKIEKYEKERGWDHPEFDFIFQFVRTILLKHGASLIYTASAAPGSLRPLIHSTLGIQSLLQRNALTPNLYERDKVLVPPNWDAWGKIRAFGEVFDIEGVSQSWSLDIQEPSQRRQQNVMDENAPYVLTSSIMADSDTLVEGSCIPLYEDRLKDPGRNDPLQSAQTAKEPEEIELECMDNQEFLGSQLQVLEKLKKEDDRENKSIDPKKFSSIGTGNFGTPGRVHEHIGPVQFNVGGIQVDADDILKGIRDREADRITDDGSVVQPPDGKSENEKLASFFAGLMKRGGSSPATPKTRD